MSFSGNTLHGLVKTIMLHQGKVAKYSVSLRIQSECGKIRTRKKLRIWTFFTKGFFSCLNLDTVYQYGSAVVALRIARQIVSIKCVCDSYTMTSNLLFMNYWKGMVLSQYIHESCVPCDRNIQNNERYCSNFSL